VTDEAVSRTARKRAERVELIARTAARVFADRGYERTAFEDIANVLDLRGPSLYHYFESKESLFVTCLNRSASEVFGRLRAIADSELRPRAKLRELIHEQVIIEVRDYPEFVPLFFGNRVAVPALQSEVLRLRREHARIFEDVAATVGDDDRLNSQPLRVWLGITFGALAYLDTWFDPTGALDAEGLAHAMAETLMSAL
jgi:AcrR family transcriptional regulator